MDKERNKTNGEPSIAPSTVPVDQRRVHRTMEACYLTYSGICGGRVIVGEGSSLDLSAEGLGIEGSRNVVPGALLTLCVCLPDGKEPLVVEEVRVVWVRGKRFGVKSVAIGHEERKRLVWYVTRYHPRGSQKHSKPLTFSLPLESVAG